MQWIKGDVILEGQKVKLVPFEMSHFDGMVTAAQDERIWQYYSINGLDTQALLRFFEEGVNKRVTGDQYTFTIIDKVSGNIIGSTRFGDIIPEHKTLEIGWTWYNTAYWGKGYNEECKLLLLEFCFESVGAITVVLKAWDKNTRSCKAIQRIGATFEGVLRDRMIRYDGIIRSSAYFSILQREWEQVKTNLTKQRDERYALYNTPLCK